MRCAVKDEGTVPIVEPSLAKGSRDGVNTPGNDCVAGWGRRSRLRTRSLIAALTVVAAIVAPACATDDLKELAEASIGQFGGERGQIVLLLHPGAPRDVLRVYVEEIVGGATREGALLKVFVLIGGSAAAMVEVPLSDAAGKGDFYPSAHNSEGWKAEAEAFRTAAMNDITPHLVAPPGSDVTGSDLLGALLLGVTEIRSLTVGEGDRRIVLITSGGVHRTTQLDLVAAEITPSNAEQLARTATHFSPGELGIEIEIRGAGRFEGIHPPVDPVFAQGVIAFWGAVCPGCDIH
jgi:hypothetical protein